MISNGGQRVEKVLISKSKSGDPANREKHPFLYVLNSSAVSELTKSADAVKRVMASGKQKLAVSPLNIPAWGLLTRASSPCRVRAGYTGRQSAGPALLMWRSPERS